MFRFTILRESRGRDRISPVPENEILAKIHGRKDVFEHKLAVHKMYSSVQISTVEHAHTHDTTTQIRRALRAKMNNELESHDTHSSQAHEWMNRFAFSSPPPPRPPCPRPQPLGPSPSAPAPRPQPLGPAQSMTSPMTSYLSRWPVTSADESPQPRTPLSRSRRSSGGLQP